MRSVFDIYFEVRDLAHDVRRPKLIAPEQDLEGRLGIEPHPGLWQADACLAQKEIGGSL